MHRQSRQSEGSGTDSRRDQYGWARLKLSFFYIGMIAVVVIVLGSTVYSLQSVNFARYDQEREEQQDEESAVIIAAEKALAEQIRDLRIAVITGGLITVLVTGILGYFLAGMTLRPIRRSHETQRRFFANAAHDLRTPLAVMKADAEVALRREDPPIEDLRRLLESQVEEIDRMSTMVGQMLLLERADQGIIRAPGAERPLELCEVVERVAGKMSEEAARKGIGIQTDLHPPAGVVGDEELLQRVFLNILQNAVTYTPSGGSITVSARHAGASIVVSTRDSGVGMSTEDLAHVTEPFYRGDSARESEGTGLGLAIVDEIVAAYGGSLHIDSAPGAGTTVSVRIPAR